MFAAESTDLATKVRDSLEELRLESVRIRHQAEVTAYELNRMESPNVVLREQFGKFTTEMAKMEEQAEVSRERADIMARQGKEFFSGLGTADRRDRESKDPPTGPVALWPADQVVQ